MGNEMGNQIVNGLQASDQDAPNESSFVSDDANGLKILSPSVELVEAENLHEKQARSDENDQSGTDDILIQKQALGLRAEDREGRTSAPNITSGTDETLPNVSVELTFIEQESASTTHTNSSAEGTKEPQFKSEEGVIGFDEKADTPGEAILDSPYESVALISNSNTEKGVLLKEIEFHEIIIDESDIADHKNKGNGEQHTDLECIRNDSMQLGIKIPSTELVSSIDLETIDFQIKSVFMEGEGKTVEKASEIEGCECELNPILKIDEMGSSDTKLTVISPSNETEEKTGVDGSQDSLIETAFQMGDTNEMKNGSKTEYHHKASSISEEYIEDSEEEMEMIEKADFRTDHMVVGSKTEDERKFSIERLEDESKLIESNETKGEIDTAFSLSIFDTVEGVSEEIMDKTQVLDATVRNTEERTEQTYGGPDARLKDQYSSADSISEERLVHVALWEREKPVSPHLDLSEQDKNLIQPGNVSPKQASAVGESETVENKEMSVTESDTKNCTVINVNIRESSNFSSRNPKPGVVTLASESKDEKNLLDEKDPSLNQIITQESGVSTCVEESGPQKHIVDCVEVVSESSNFTSQNLNQNVETLATALELQDEKKPSVHQKMCRATEISTSESSDPSVKSTSELQEEEPKCILMDHEGIHVPNISHETLEYEGQSVTELNQEKPTMEIDDSGSTSYNVEKTVAKSKASALEAQKENIEQNPKDSTEPTSEPLEELKCILMDHESIQDSTNTSLGKLESDARSTTELNQENPSMEIDDSRSSSNDVGSKVEQTEDSALQTQEEDSGPNPLQHVTTVKGLISVFERCGFDTQENLVKPVTAIELSTEETKKIPLLHCDKTAKGDLFAYERCLSDSEGTMSGSFTNANLEVDGKATAETELPAFKTINEESNQNPLLHQQKHGKKAVSALEQSNSEKLRVPLLSLLKGEDYVVEPLDKQKGIVVKTAENVWKSPANKTMATIPRGRDKQKPRSSFFSNCMCCTTVIQ